MWSSQVRFAWLDQSLGFGGKDHRVTLPCSLPAARTLLIHEEDLPQCPQLILLVPHPCLSQVLVKGRGRAPPITTHTRGALGSAQGSPSLNTFAQKTSLLSQGSRTCSRRPGSVWQKLRSRWVSLQPGKPGSWQPAYC